GVRQIARQVTACGEGADAERIAIGAERRDALAHVLGGRAIHHHPRAGLELPAALPRADDEGVAAEARHGGLEGCQRAQRRIEEQQPQDPPGQRARLGLLFQAPRELQERQHLVALEVREIEKTLHAGSSRSASRSRSTCCSSRMSGGSRRSTCGSLAVPVRMQHSSSSAWISFAGRLVRSPTSRPTPWCALTGPRTQLLRIYALTRRTRSSSAARNGAPSATAPASPCTGSTITAAVCLVTSAVMAAVSPRGMKLTSKGVRGNPYHCACAPQVTAPAAAVRP